MTWAKLDDGFWCHLKVQGLQLESIGVWTLALSWCAKHGSDGAIPRKLPRILEWPETAVTELVAEGLWDETATGWEVHDYLDYNPSKAELDSKLAADRDRKRVAKTRDRRKRIDGREVSDIPLGKTAAFRPLPIPISSSLSTSSDLISTAAVLAPIEPQTATAAEPSSIASARASKGSNRIAEATGDSFHPLTPKHKIWLEGIGLKSDVEWTIAAQVLREQVKVAGVRRMLTPQHILENWNLYSRGEWPRSAKTLQSERDALKPAVVEAPYLSRRL